MAIILAVTLGILKTDFLEDEKWLSSILPNVERTQNALVSPPAAPKPLFLDDLGSHQLPGRDAQTPHVRQNWALLLCCGSSLGKVVRAGWMGALLQTAGRGTVCSRAGGVRAFDTHPPSALQSTLSGGHPRVINSPARCRSRPPPAIWLQRPLTGVHPRGLSETCRAESSCISLHKPLSWDSLSKGTRVGRHAFFQRIVPTQGLNLGLLELLRCRVILYL